MFVGLIKVQIKTFPVFLSPENGTKEREIAEKMILPNRETVVIIFYKIFELGLIRKF